MEAVSAMSEQGVGAGLQAAQPPSKQSPTATIGMVLIALIMLIVPFIVFDPFGWINPRTREAPAPKPFDPDAPTCEEYGLCFCESCGDAACNGKVNVVGKYLVADPEKKLETTHNLKTINGENALAWFAKQGAGKGCGSLTCPFKGDEVVFETRENRWVVNDFYDTPKEMKDPNNAEYDPNWESWRAPTYGEEPQGDYYPACAAD